MPLNLEQYADYLDTRTDLLWPAAPEVKPPKARPHLVRLPNVRAVTWSVYGTLLSISEGDLCFEHPQSLIMSLALDKTIQEFKMWPAMTRKRGLPADQMRLVYNQVLHELRFQETSDERHPEIQAEKVWERILKKLLMNEYAFDIGFFGSLIEYSRKVAYFFHASLQGTAAQPGAAEALTYVRDARGIQGLLADGQCFTPIQLNRALRADGFPNLLADSVATDLRVFSYEVRARKPSPRLFAAMVSRLRERGIEPREVLHVGAHLANDVAAARKLGMRTALYAGDKSSVDAPTAKLKDPKHRPDVLLTELTQISDVIG